MEIEQVISKIRKLCARTVERGCTEAEAMTAAATVGELLKVYNLSLDKVFLEQHQCVVRSVRTRQINRSPVDSCVMAIANLCDCKVWFDKSYSDKPSAYSFFGMETDADMAVYLYDMIANAVEWELNNFKKQEIYQQADVHRKRLSTSFQRGMAFRIDQRLREMKKNREKKYSQEKPQQTFHQQPASVSDLKNPGTDIVLMKMKKVESEFEKLGMHLRKSYAAARQTHFSAFAQGKAAGDNVNLSRPLNQKPIGNLT